MHFRIHVGQRGHHQEQPQPWSAQAEHRWQERTIEGCLAKACCSESLCGSALSPAGVTRSTPAACDDASEADPTPVPQSEEAPSRVSEDAAGDLGWPPSSSVEPRPRLASKETRRPVRIPGTRRSSSKPPSPRTSPEPSAEAVPTDPRSSPPKSPPPASAAVPDAEPWLSALTDPRTDPLRACPPLDEATELDPRLL